MQKAYLAADFSYASPLLADFDGDGFLDAVSNGSDIGLGGILLALNDQKGHFPASTGYIIDSRMQSILSGDWNGDKVPDLAALDRRSLRSELVLVANKGRAVFDVPLRFRILTAADTVFTGDINGDGHADLGIGAAGAAVVVLGLGDGSFWLPRATAGVASQPAVGDLDGDGALDLVGRAAPDAVVYRGKGDGTFTVGATYPVDATIWDLVVADVNGDNRLDLVAVAWNGDVLARLGNGDATFGAATRSPANASRRRIAVGDWDNDGRADLVTGGQSTYFMKGDGKGGFGAAVALGGAGDQIVPLDADGDGNLDFATDAGAVYLGKGDGTFKAGSFGLGFGSIAVGDCNGDGRPDLFLVNNWPYVFANDGKGNFKSSWSPGTTPGFLLNPFTADFDKDGKLDFAITNGSAITFVYRGKGDCTFTEAGNWTPWTSAVADFTGDSQVDLLGTSAGAIVVTPNQSL